jgi:tRNA threonylcarbamoyl adenosine modification protein YeaZ
VKTLAIESATPASSVAVGDGGQLLAMALNVDKRGHVGFLTDAVDFCMRKAGLRPVDLDMIIVDVGPGAFTGIRAGIATAQGVGAAVGVPVRGASSLDALAFRAATGHRRIWPLIDARRGEYATASYRPVPGGVVKETLAELLSPEQLRATLDSDPENSLVVGDWQGLPPAVLRGLHRVKTGRPRYPSADVLLELAAQQAARPDPAQWVELRPMYLRQPDTEINWKTFRTEGVWPE